MVIITLNFQSSIIIFQFLLFNLNKLKQYEKIFYFYNHVFHVLRIYVGSHNINSAKRNVLDLKNETCKNLEKRNVLKKSRTRHFKAIKKQSKTGCFYSF